MQTSKKEVFNVVKKFFKDNPEISYKSFEEDVYEVFLNVQEESIKPYEPLKVDIIDKNTNEYDVSEIHQKTGGISDDIL